MFFWPSRHLYFYPKLNTRSMLFNALQCWQEGYSLGHQCKWGYHWILVYNYILLKSNNTIASHMAILYAIHFHNMIISPNFPWWLPHNQHEMTWQSSYDQRINRFWTFFICPIFLNFTIPHLGIIHINAFKHHKHINLWYQSMVEGIVIQFLFSAHATLAWPISYL